MFNKFFHDFLPLSLKLEVVRFVLFGILFFLLAWFLSYPLQGIIFYLFSYICWLFWQLLKLFNWIKLGMIEGSNNNTGVYGELYKALSLKRQRQIKLVRKMRGTIKRSSELTHAIGEGVVVLAKDLSLTWWNVSARSLLGLEPSDNGHTITSLIRDPAFSDYLSHETFEGSFELSARTDPDKTLLYTASHFGEDAVVLVVADITELKNMEKLRKEFVGNVSHELRTPITVLKGYLETLADGVIVDSALIQKACLQMSEQVIRMQALADDLITLSRLEEPPKELPIQKVFLLGLLESIVREANIVSDGNHKITYECGPDVYILAQETDIYSMFSNLLFNAVRHNPQGATIQINTMQEEGSLIVTVIDDGVGISAEALPKLTERFYRTDTSRSTQVKGTGLGLAIVKHIVQRFNGNLDIKSKLGEGSEFILRFPQ